MAPRAYNTRREDGAPSHEIWQPPRWDGDRWVRVGAAWPTGNGKGQQLRLPCLPEGRSPLVMLRPGERAISTEPPRPSAEPTHDVWFAPKRRQAGWARIGGLWPMAGNASQLRIDLAPRMPGTVLVFKRGKFQQTR